MSFYHRYSSFIFTSVQIKTARRRSKQQELQWLTLVVSSASNCTITSQYLVTRYAAIDLRFKCNLVPRCLCVIYILVNFCRNFLLKSTHFTFISGATQCPMYLVVTAQPIRWDVQLLNNFVVNISIYFTDQFLPLSP